VSQPQHRREAWCVKEDSLVSLSMRLMREGAAADLATNEALADIGISRGNSNTSISFNNNINSGSSSSREHAGWAVLAEPGSALDATEAAAEAAAAAASADAAAEPSALLLARADALLSTVRLCDGLFVSEGLLRTEVREIGRGVFLYVHCSI